MLEIFIGFLFATVGVNVLNSFTEVITAFFEWLRAMITVKIVKCNHEIEQIQQQAPTTPTRAIGFDIKLEEEDDADES